MMRLYIYMHIYIQIYIQMQKHVILHSNFNAFSNAKYVIIGIINIFA